MMIKKRNLDDKIIDWIRAENRELTEFEFIDLLTKVRSNVCSICDQDDQILKRFAFTTLIGAFFTTISEDHLYIACERCGRQKRKESFRTTLMLGWWSIKGFFTIPFILFDKFKNAQNEDELSERILRQFILENIGSITLAGDSKEFVRKLMADLNKLNTESE